MNQAVKSLKPTIKRQQLTVPLPKPKVKVYKSVGKRLVKQKPLPMERMKDLSNPVEHHVESRIQKVSPMNQGDIKQAPSKLTQAYRRFKNDESGPYNMAKNIVTAAATLAPIPSLGKINAVKKISNLAKGKKRVGSIGGFKEFANPKLRNHFNPVKKSKPVDYMGPNPMHKSGAGGNSYPK